MQPLEVRGRYIDQQHRCANTVGRNGVNCGLSPKGPAQPRDDDDDDDETVKKIESKLSTIALLCLFFSTLVPALPPHPLLPVLYPRHKGPGWTEILLPGYSGSGFTEILFSGYTGFN